jgi:hypothetical protein
MADITAFISWYMLQNFPVFKREMLEAAAASVAHGYEEAKEIILSVQGTDRDQTVLAMVSVLKVMSRYDLEPEAASYLLRRLNNLAAFQEQERIWQRLNDDDS